MIFVVEFGGQTAHLIARRVRDFGVGVELVDPDEVLDGVRDEKPAGIILSGGPASVYEKDAPKVSKRIFSLRVPVLGICYGHMCNFKSIQEYIMSRFLILFFFYNSMIIFTF